MGCLTEDDALGFASGLEVGDRAAHEAHLDGCAECRRLVSFVALTEPSAGSQPSADGMIGRFTIKRPAGAGGMGVVFEAWDPKLCRPVAIKLLREGVGTRDRLLRESRALAQLNHPNVVTLYDVGDLGDEVYLAMEFVEGVTTGAWMRELHHWREVVDVFAQAGRGLHAAHAIGLVHRDVKPENMLLGRDGRVRIGDFGVVGALAGEPTDDGALTQPGTVVGTPRYMAPEVRRGEPATAASDQWSFAASMWHALEPHDAPAPAPANDAAKPRAPAWVLDVLTRGLAEDPAARWPSVDAMLRALRPRRRVGWYVAAGLVTIAAAGAVAIWLAGGDRGEEPCAGVDAELAAVWNAPRRSEVAGAIAATRSSAAALTARQITEGLDRYAERWRGLRRSVCLAPPSPAFALQTSCLDRKLASFDATIRSLRGVSRTNLGDASDSVDTLGPVDECGDAELLIKGELLPSDPERRRRLAKISRQLEAAIAKWRLDQDPDVLPIAKEAAAMATEYAPLRARALQLVALVQRARLDPGVVATLRDAIAAATRAGDAVLQAELAIALVDSSLVAPRDPAQLDFELAEADAKVAALARLAPETAERLRGFLVVAHGVFALERGSEESIDLFRSAIPLSERQYGTDSWRVGRLRGMLVVALVRAGRFREAADEAGRSLPLVERHLDANHPERATAYHVAAAAYHFVGDDRRARELTDKALAIARVNKLVPLEIAVEEMVADVEMTTGDLAGGITTIDHVLALAATTPNATDVPRVRARLACARDAATIATTPAGVARDRARLGAGECMIAARRAQVAVPLLEPGVVDGAKPDELHVRLRFALARALGDRGLDGDDARARREAGIARKACANIPNGAAIAKAIDTWLQS